MEMGGYMAPPPNDAWLFTGGRSTPNYDSFPALSGAGGNTEPASKAPSAHEHDAALALEGMALGRDIKNLTGKRDDAHEEADEPTPGSPLTFSSYIRNKRNAKDSGELGHFPAVNKLPSLIVGKYVIAHFLEHVDFRWRCLHRPTFEEQYRQLSARLRLKSDALSRDELSTLALYASCLAVGIHFLDEEGYRDLSMNEDQADKLAQTCWEVSYQALEASDWMQVHDIRSCQTIIIAGIYLSSVRRANQHWTLLGSATKVAMALGLCNVPDEAKIISGELHRIPQRWQSTIDREVARRVWYCLLELDWLFSMEYGFLYTISPEIHQTTEPANVNDADIKDNEPVVSLPLDTYTDMSYFLQRLRLFYPFMSVVQKARKAGRMMESHLGVDRNGRAWHQRNSHTWYETAVRPQKHIRPAIRLSDTVGAKPYLCETYSWLLSSQGFLQHFSGIFLRSFLTIIVSKRLLNQQRMYIIPTEHTPCKTHGAYE